MKKKLEKETLYQSYSTKSIRASWDASKKEMFFCLPDVISAVTLTGDPADYLKKLRKRIPSLRDEWAHLVEPHTVKTKGGMQPTNCANALGVYRIIAAMPLFRKQPLRAFVEEQEDAVPPKVNRDTLVYSLTDVYLLAEKAAKKAGVALP